MNTFEKFKNKTQRQERTLKTKHRDNPGSSVRDQEGLADLFTALERRAGRRNEPLEKILQKGGNNKGYPLSTELQAVTVVPSPSRMALRCDGY